MAFYYALHSLLAHQPIKDRLMHFVSKRYYRMLYNLIAMGLLLPVVYMYSRVDHVTLFKTNSITHLAGGLCIFSGLLLMIMALRQYNLSQFVGISDLKKLAGKELAVLKISGINRWMRHPLYTAILILLNGFVLIKPNTASLGLAIISLIYILIGIQLEERKLIVEFGEDYVKYRKDVSMLIPFLF